MAAAEQAHAPTAFFLGYVIGGIAVIAAIVVRVFISRAPKDPKEPKEPTDWYPLNLAAIAINRVTGDKLDPVAKFRVEVLRDSRDRGWHGAIFDRADMR